MTTTIESTRPTHNYLEQKVELIKEISYKIDPNNITYDLTQSVHYVIRFNGEVIARSTNQHRTEKLYYWIISDPSILKTKEEILHSAIYYVPSEDISNKTN